MISLRKWVENHIDKENLKIPANHESLMPENTMFQTGYEASSLLVCVRKNVTVGQSREIKRNHHKYKPASVFPRSSLCYFLFMVIRIVAFAVKRSEEMSLTSLPYYWLELNRCGGKLITVTFWLLSNSWAILEAEKLLTQWMTVWADTWLCRVLPSVGQYTGNVNFGPNFFLGSYPSAFITIKKIQI